MDNIFPRWHGDQIFQDENCMFWFWNETWSEKYGPFNSLSSAESQLKRYTEYLNG